MAGEDEDDQVDEVEVEVDDERSDESERFLSLPLFFCWLAARGQSYIGKTGQLNHFNVAHTPSNSIIAIYTLMDLIVCFLFLYLLLTDFFNIFATFQTI